MAQAVPEVLAVAGGGDDSRATPSTARPAGSSVPRPRPARRLRSASIGRGLGPRDELVDVEVARGRLADEQRPRHVAPVAGDLRPEVEQQDRAVTHGPIARGAVRQRRLRTGQAGDVERQRLGAAGPDQPLQAKREVALGRRPARMSGSSVARARSATAQAAAIRSISAGSFVARSASIQPSIGTSSTSGRRSREPVPHGVRDEPGLDPDPPRPERARRGRASATGGRRRRPRAGPPAPRAGPGSCTANRRSTTTSSPPTRNWPELAGDLLLARPRA